MQKLTRSISLIFLFFLLACTQNSYGQKPQQPVKIKPPKVYVSWGNSKEGPYSKDVFINLLDSSIQVVSEKKEVLAISRAMLIYRSKDQVEDEKGKVKTHYNTYMNEIRNDNKVPEKWKSFLAEEIKPGDLFLITDMHVRDKQGYIFSAPDLKITIE